MSQAPLSVDQALTRAKSLARKGEVAQARQIYTELLQRFPGNRRALEGLTALGGPRHAAGAQPRAGSLEEAVALYTQGRLADALAITTALLRQQPDAAEAWNLQGAIETLQDRPAAAAASYQRAVALSPGYAEAHHNLGNVWKQLGRPEAEASFRRALELRPAYAEAHRNLSTIHTYTAGDPHLAAMAALSEGPTLPSQDRMHLCFALAKAYEDVGDVDRSFSTLSEANRLRKAALRYDIASDRQLFARIKALFEGPAPKAVVAASKVRIDPRPIFIVGMPRSGTTLVEQILASHSQVHGAGELTLLNRLAMATLADPRSIEGSHLTGPALARVRSAYAAGLAALATGRPVVTDKMPSNFRWLGIILEAMPEATVVHVRRDPVATCWAVFKTYFATGGNGFAYDLEDVAAYYKLYRELMAFWHARYPGRIFDLDYEMLTQAQEAETRRLLAACGLSFEDRCLEFHATERAVATASSAQVRQKIYRGSSDSWRKFERHLDDLVTALADMAAPPPEGGRGPTRG